MSAGNGSTLELALIANAENAQTVASRLKLMMLGDFVLFILDHFTEELDQQPAVCTDQVVVMLMVVKVLIASAPISESLFARQPAFREKLKCTVDCSEPDLRITNPYQMMQLLSA